MARLLKSDGDIPGGEQRPSRHARSTRLAIATILIAASASLGQVDQLATPVPAAVEGASQADPSPSAPQTKSQSVPPAPRDTRPLGPYRASARPTSREAAHPDDSSGAVGKRPAGRLGIGQVMGALGFVLALILVLFRAIRHGARAKGGLIGAAGAGGKSPAGVLSILARYPIGRGQTLLLMKLDRRVLLVAQTAGGRGPASLATLTELTDPEEIASLCAKCGDDAERRRFQSELSKFGDEADDAIKPTRQAAAAPIARASSSPTTQASPPKAIRSSTPAMKPSSAEIAGSARSHATDADDELLPDDLEMTELELDPEPAPSVAVTSLRHRLASSRRNPSENAA